MDARNIPTSTLVERAPRRSLVARLVETARVYSHLGCTSFGGPGVHVIIFRRKFVDHLKWLDSTTFNDLFALGNALPGPGSTQLAFSIALVRNGILAGLLAFIIWSFPGAIGMAALGIGVRSIPSTIPNIVLATLTGLNAATVGLIALAAYNLSKTTITDKITRLVLLGSAAFGVCYHAPWMYPSLMVAGGITTLTWDNRYRLISPLTSRFRVRNSVSRHNVSTQQMQEDPEAIELSDRSVASASKAGEKGARDPVARIIPEVNADTGIVPSTNLARASSLDPFSSGVRQRPTSHAPFLSSSLTNELADTEERTPLITLRAKPAIATAVAFVGLVIVFVVIRATVDGVNRLFEFFVNMIIAGIIIFGGGPVVIPLLRGYTVDNGWVSSRDFLLGFAILQAFPGPNFNFAVYLGVLAVPSAPVFGAFLGFLGIFSPGIMLKLALLPLYKSWRSHEVAKSVLRGLNASAVGLIYTAVWQLFLVGYIYTPASGLSPDGTVSGTVSGPLTADPWWGVIAVGAFTATEWYGSPPPVSIILGALGGLAWHAIVNK